MATFLAAAASDLDGGYDNFPGKMRGWSSVLSDSVIGTFHSSQKNHWFTETDMYRISGKL